MSTTIKQIEPHVPALIVFGTPTGASAPQAAWFRGAYSERAKQAAQRQAFRAVQIDSDETMAAAATLSEGQLKPGGQLIMTDVSQEVFDRLSGLRLVTVGNVPASAAGVATAPAKVSAALWDTLKISDYVLAAHIENGETDGWYEAIILKIEGATYTVRWADYPKERLIRVQRRHIALMLPG
jgi:hypothetical protein